MKFILILFFISTLYILFQQFKIAWLFSKFQKGLSGPNSSSKDVPVSVIICARNEEHNLLKNLKFVLEQDYSLFEVLIVDDNSIDATSDVVQKFQKNHSHLELLQIKNQVSNSKRNALKQGVLKAKYDLVLLTDADCKPQSTKWISSMVNQLSSTRSCVLGYSPYEFQFTFLNSLIQFETLQTAVLFLSKAIDNKAYMSVGRNVMYSKKLFLESENFENERHLTSGDDDLLIQNIKDKSQITINLESNSFVTSQPKSTWGFWWKQKQRHYTTAPLYDRSSQSFLGMYHLAHALFWFCILLLAFSSFSRLTAEILGIVIFLKTLLLLFFAKLFKVGKPILLIWPILEVSLLLFQSCIMLSGQFKNQNTWK